MVKKNIAKMILLALVILLVVLFLIRLFSEKHLDDVNPLILCDEDLLNKADIFYIIPIFENMRISDNKDWCEKILSYNKTLGLHGVYHTYEEFAIDRSEEYLQEGAEIFKECFGYYPERFKTPQLTISEDNKNLLKNKYIIDTWFTTRFHKQYHCGDSLSDNWVSDLI